MPYVRCQVCNEIMYVKQSYLNYGWGKCCSLACRHQKQLTGKFVNCYKCGKKVWRTPAFIKKSKSGLFFCSKGCSMTWKNSDLYSGEKHPLWNGGAAVYRLYKERSDDPKVCKMCGITDFRVLIVHHVDHNRRNNNLNNLMWLCRNCHYIIHDGKTA